MNKLVSVILSIILGTFLLYLPAKAEEQSNIISAKGTASTEAKPDVVNIIIAVETEDKNLEPAIKENNALSKNIYKSLKELLDDDNAIKTMNYNISPIYSNYRPQKNEITGYRVNNQIRINTKEIEKLGEIIQKSLENGANRISSLTYGISNRQAICQELLDEAALNAKKEAEILAKALNLKIKGIRKISSNCNGANITPRFMGKYDMGVSAEAAMLPPVESGEIMITSQVFIEFIIE